MTRSPPAPATPARLGPAVGWAASPATSSRPLATVRAQICRAQAARAPLSDTARRVIADLTHEAELRRALTWRDRAREDHQRERAASTALPGATSAAAPRHTIRARRTAAADWQEMARAALARADAVTDKIDAELRLRERLPDHPPYRPTHRGEIPDWVADRHAMTHPGTPDHWSAHLAERHRILARALADRGHVLAAAPPGWARPLGPPPPASSPRRRHAWAPPPRWWNCGPPATPSPPQPEWARGPPQDATSWTTSTSASAP